MNDSFLPTPQQYDIGKQAPAETSAAVVGAIGDLGNTQKGNSFLMKSRQQFLDVVLRTAKQVHSKIMLQEKLYSVYRMKTA